MWLCALCRLVAPLLGLADGQGRFLAWTHSIRILLQAACRWLFLGGSHRSCHRWAGGHSARLNCRCSRLGVAVSLQGMSWFCMEQQAASVMHLFFTHVKLPIVVRVSYHVSRTRQLRSLFNVLCCSVLRVYLHSCSSLIISTFLFWAASCFVPVCQSWLTVRMIGSSHLFTELLAVHRQLDGCCASLRSIIQLQIL